MRLIGTILTISVAIADKLFWDARSTRALEQAGVTAGRQSGEVGLIGMIRAVNVAVAQIRLGNALVDLTALKLLFAAWLVRCGREILL